MSRQNGTQVNGRDGWQGWLEHPFDMGREAQVRLDDGTVLVMPADWLEPRDDGSYFVSMDRPELEQDGSLAAQQPLESTVLPVIEEVLRVDTRRETTGGVRIRKTIREHEETINPELVHESVEVERVAVGRFVDAAISPRQEGDTLVIPIFEEVLVVEKRLRLIEEVRITKTRRTEQQAQTVRLREEQVSIDSLGGEGGVDAARITPPTQ